MFHVYLKHFTRCETNKTVYFPGCGAFDSVPVTIVSHSLAYCFLSISLFTCTSRYQSSPTSRREGSETEIGINCVFRRLYFYGLTLSGSKSSPIWKLRSKTTNIFVVWVKSCANNAQLTNGLTHQSLLTEMAQGLFIRMHTCEKRTTRIRKLGSLKGMDSSWYSFFTGNGHPH